jgi:diacylglycerol kinase
VILSSYKDKNVLRINWGVVIVRLIYLVEIIEFCTFEENCKHMTYLKNRIRSFRHAITGLCLLFRETPNARIQLIVAIAVVSVGFLLHISSAEWFAVIVAIGLVLALEAINSAVEALADYACQKEIHPSIKKVKDLAAAGVLIAALAALAVGLVVFLSKII